MDNTTNQEEAVDILKELTIQDFLDVGLDQVAYIKRIDNSGDDAQGIYAVHAADGSQISVMDSYDMALSTIRGHDLFPVPVH